jgi:hypothetical protein
VLLTASSCSQLLYNIDIQITESRMILDLVNFMLTSYSKLHFGALGSGFGAIPSLGASKDLLLYFSNMLQVL